MFLLSVMVKLMWTDHHDNHYDKNAKIICSSDSHLSPLVTASLQPPSPAAQVPATRIRTRIRLTKTVETFLENRIALDNHSST